MKVNAANQAESLTIERHFKCTSWN